MANDQEQQCKNCGNDQDVHLHIEIENLKQKLVERDTHIAAMETNVLNEANKFPNGEFIALQDELLTWQDKYKRLYDAHKRIQRVNQGLEDKLLRLVDSCETEKGTLTKDVATLSHKLAEANYAIKKLTEDNERYKEDVALAIQFLQCKQGNFVSQKLDSLPNEVQAKVSMYVGGKKSPQEKKIQSEVKSIKVPIPTFPPTAMVYSIPKSTSQEKECDESDNQSVDIVSAAIMAKVLEERERERALAKHCDTCTCSKGLKIIHDTTTHCVGTQTGDSKHSVCLRCNGEMDSISGVKIVKSLVLTNKSNTVPIYANDYEGNLLTSEGDDRIIRPNVVKVEPNNYLKENISICSNESQKSSFLSKNSSSPGFQVVNCDLSAKDSSKGPRYCSVRLQSGSKNILLDNVHNKFAPVLYTHPNDKKIKKGQNNTKVHHNHTVSQNSNINIPGYSSDEANSFNLIEDSLQNQQRVAEWIQTNQINGSYADNSKLASGENNKNDYFNTIDPIRYAEMENNVKKFLLGESQSEFFKKVAIGKQNYQNLRGNANAEVDESAQNLHSETQI